MKRLLKFCLLSVFGLITVNYIWGNLVFQNQVATLIKVAAILTLFEFLIKPVVRILLLPINFLTLGAARVVINTLGFYLALFLIDDFSLNDIHTNVFQWQGFSIPPLNFNGFVAVLVTSLSLWLVLVLFKSILTKKQK
jgi:putative membrane protein